MGTLPTMPLARRGGEVLITLAVFAVIVQLPGNSFIALLLPPLALLYNGIRVAPHEGEWSVWVWMALTLVPSFIAMATDGLLLERNFFLITLSLALTAAVVFRGSDGDSGAKALMNGMFVGFATLASIGVVEVVTGFKLLFVRYPDSVVASWAVADRLITTAMYPNFNDFSVALALLCIFIAARFLVRPGSVGVQVWRVAIVLLLGAWIFHMGSRGALLGLVAGLVVLILLSERRRDASSLPGWFLIMVTSAVIGAAFVLSQTVFVQDENTAERMRILARLWELVSLDPLRALIGFGAATHLDGLSQQFLGGSLVNPHNIFAEAMLWGGILGLFGFLLCWGYIAWQAVLNRTGASWYSMGAVAATLVMPLLGVTPSVVLHYLFPQLLMIVAVATMDRSASPTLSARVEDSCHQQPSETGQRHGDDQPRQLA